LSDFSFASPADNILVIESQHYEAFNPVAVKSYVDLDLPETSNGRYRRRFTTLWVRTLQFNPDQISTMLLTSERRSSKSVALGPLRGAFPILSLRTNKADVAVGVSEMVARDLDAQGIPWRTNGK
jgi:hypothetical protein